ncbi:hypothetical protein HPB47_006911 [Ixodes persulcatus]|uniref:Uncharacterized protein n=1 Tax=Ixodes persulcatus TaxID=34615 RepID=A0AC60P9W5_IXOPE|nr:hypothetical protein HPB47_006911 [Ixodes persulcatus]
MTPASLPQPTKACTFDVSFPPGASVDSIFGAAAAIVGTAELYSVQHLGGSNVQLSVTSSSAMSRIVNAGALTIGGTSVPIVPVGPQVTSITCPLPTEQCEKRSPRRRPLALREGSGYSLRRLPIPPQPPDGQPLQGSGDTPAPAEPPVTTPSELAQISQQSKPASATDTNSNASQDAAEAALSNAVETASVHAPTPPSSGSEEVLVKEEPPRTTELRPSTLPNWSDITEDSASSSDDRLVIDEVARDKDSALPRGRDRRRGTSEELRKTCSRSRRPHGGAEDAKRGFRSVTKQIEVLQFARTARWDLLFLQETNFHRQRDVDLFKQWYGVDYFFSHATTRSSGVGAIIFNPSLLRLSACCFDPDGRYIAFDFCLDGTRFRAVGVYAPAQPSRSLAFFKSLDVHLLDARHCLLLGDFNCVVDSRRDVRGPVYGRTTWNAGELIRLMQHFDLVDCWTLLHGTAFEHTWQRGGSSSRLGRYYTSEFLSPSVTACCAMNFPPSIAYISDHRPLLVEIRISSAASSESTWRLDTRLLTRENKTRLSLHGAALDPTTFVRLQESWRVACVAKGRALPWRHAEQLRDTSMRIRIVRRGGAGTPLMRGYLQQLLDRCQRQLLLCTNAATAYHGRVGPTAHPKRFARPTAPKCGSDASLQCRHPQARQQHQANRRSPVSAYADDITLCLRDTKDLAAALRLFETYGSLSGARLNEQKSAVLCINRPPDPSTPIPTKTSVTILGVTYRSSRVSADMWTRMARDIGAKVDRARTYALPLAGRRYLAYSVFCGRLSYLAQAALPTSRFIRRRGRSSSPGRSSAHRDSVEWGFPSIDIAAAVLQLTTTLKILRVEHGPVRSFALYFVGHSRRDLGVESPSSPGPCAETPPPDYRRALQLFIRLEERAPLLDVMETPTARLTEVLLEPQISATQVELGDSFSLSRLTSSYFLEHLRDFEWQRV